MLRISGDLIDSAIGSLDRQYSSESRRSKSFEEREEEYEKVRKRIFSQEVRELH
ncbi:hypothetical protein SK128_025722 [Halocaridina rubra]|uniref:SUZ domain-containing protein n=1 Tax=Halocaridina rubra TaxID=373956 RepID=A0AAN9AAB9_HALRR